MFYLTYRPQTIGEIDNSTIREKLQNILTAEHVPHAFLFTGPKGVGKTSSARILAKSVNCLNNSFAGKGKSFEPCNTCENCTAITSGHAADVIEMDAASNRKIDEIRDLIANIKFIPLYTKYKVYIIDEVHMLTTEAFNALLKTLEEPPESTIFVLATTELDKLPKTIVSRCITLHFGKAKNEDIVHMLKRIQVAEKQAFTDEVLEYIAQKADYSFRDGAKILEEVVAQKTTTLPEIKKLLGFTGEEMELLHILKNKTVKDALFFVEEYDKKGGSIKNLIESLLELLHDTILEPEKNMLSLKEATVLIKLLQEAYAHLKISPIEVLPLEVAFVEYFQIVKK